MSIITVLAIAVWAFFAGLVIGGFEETGRWAAAARTGRDVWSGNSRYRVYKQREGTD